VLLLQGNSELMQFVLSIRKPDPMQKNLICFMLILNTRTASFSNGQLL